MLYIIKAHSNRRMVVIRGWGGEREIGSYLLGTEFQFFKMNSDLEMESGCITM